MIPKEQIAHDLALVYLSNKYGVDVNGYFNVSSNSNDDKISEVFGSGSVATIHIPEVNEPQFVKVGTGEKGIFGIEKKKKVQSGFLVDNIFKNMIEDYNNAYVRFFEMLDNR